MFPSKIPVRKKDTLRISSSGSTKNTVKKKNSAFKETVTPLNRQINRIDNKNTIKSRSQVNKGVKNKDNETKICVSREIGLKSKLELSKNVDKETIEKSSTKCEEILVQNQDLGRESVTSVVSTEEVNVVEQVKHEENLSTPPEVEVQRSECETQSYGTSSPSPCTGHLNFHDVNRKDLSISSVAVGVQHGGVSLPYQHICADIASVDSTPTTDILVCSVKMQLDTFSNGNDIEVNSCEMDVEELCAGRETCVDPSIGVECADMNYEVECSEIATALPSVVSTSRPTSTDADDDQVAAAAAGSHLAFNFQNGRLVFQTVTRDSESDSDSILYSKDLNKRSDDTRSCLKHVEHKLKRAGIVDDALNKNYDANHNTIEHLCQFDPSQIDTLNIEHFDGYGYVEVYDEYEESDSEEIIMRETSSSNSMAIKHNPDKDKLRSLLKKPGTRTKEKKNRVVFNENKNEFFDADYIILIREECDYDEDDEETVCTCNQHEMVRLQCCEPDCSCMYDQTPQSPKFAPPIEFVDAVTLSPPEGYKDMELGEQQLLALQQMARRSQRAAAVCRECRECSQDDDQGESERELSQRADYGSRRTEGKDDDEEEEQEEEEKEKTDQSQQTTPTTPPNEDESPSSQRNYILETISMTTVTEQRIVREIQQGEEEEEEERRIPSPVVPPSGSPISGILKGGRLWKQQSIDTTSITDTQIPDSDDDTSNKRSVRFIESEGDKRDSCDGASDNPQDEVDSKEDKPKNELKPKVENVNSSPESTEMTLTFKLGNHVLISNNSLKPNSAVRQLFPCTKPAMLKGENDEEAIHQYLVTAESLRAFEEAKRSKLPQMIQSGETDESIKRAIERNTLRRSLIRYEPKSRKNLQKTDNSLVERIKQLTCDVDDVEQEGDRVSPPGEEARNSPEVSKLVHDKSFSPSSSSTTSSNSSGMSSTYKKITDLFGKRDKLPDVQNNPLPDLGGPNQEMSEAAKMNMEPRRQFLAPLTACVSAMGNADEYYYHMGGDRMSMASSVGTEYSLEDIDEGLKNGGGEEECKRIAPDVLAGTPSASESGDELAMFVQQDAGRIERIKKKYHPDEKRNDDEDDEHDDYGFNRRPSVRGIKPRFGSTTEILQQIQNQLQPPLPNRVNWPYYSESGLDNKTRNTNYHGEDVKRNFGATYRPTSLQDENLYANCAVGNQRCVYYESLPRSRSNSGSGRPQSPPPLEMSKYRQTMVYIPYNHIEAYQPQQQQQQQQQQQYYEYSRVSNQNQINKRYIEPIYAQRVPPDYNATMNNKQMLRMPYMRTESPQPQHFSTARSTQTPAAAMSTQAYYQGNPRYRSVMGGGAFHGEGTYVTKINRHSFPAGNPRFPSAPDNISLTDSDSVHSGQMLSNGYTSRQTDINFPGGQKEMGSPTKTRFIERGVPEGAASISPQDSSTSPQTNQKPMFYAMNV